MVKTTQPNMKLFYPMRLKNQTEPLISELIQINFTYE